MSGVLVEFHGEYKIKVDSYDNLDEEFKSGEYWEVRTDKELEQVKKHIKNHYIKIQDYTCPYCRQRFEVDHNGVWDIDHIIPKDKYPKFLFSPLNLCVSCKNCNQEKSNKNVLKNKKRKTLPCKSSDYIISHPHLDEYGNHIKILKSSLFFIPLDEKGKETIEICGLLRFLYKFTEYGNVSVEVKDKIGQLHDDLVRAESAIEESFILSCISDVVEHGKQLAKKEHLEKLRA